MRHRNLSRSVLDLLIASYSIYRNWQARLISVEFDSEFNRIKCTSEIVRKSLFSHFSQERPKTTKLCQNRQWRIATLLPAYPSRPATSHHPKCPWLLPLRMRTEREAVSETIFESLFCCIQDLSCLFDSLLQWRDLFTCSAHTWILCLKAVVTMMLMWIKK